MEQLDVLCVGNAMIDIFLAVLNGSKYCSVDHDSCKISFDAGAKILVNESHMHLGGNAANVSVGIARFDFKSALLAELGTDEFATKIVNGLQSEKVHTDFIKQTSGAQSTFSVILDIMGERTIFPYHVTRMHELSLPTTAPKWIYLTSLGEKWEELYGKVANYVRAKNIPLMFNPGSYQLKSGREHFRNILEITTIIVVNREEAEEIVYGAPQHTDSQANTPEKLLEELQKFGPKIAVITDGTNGSYAMDEKGKFYQQDILPGGFVEKTGAGDAYSSGFLAATMLQKDIQEAMLWGSADSISVIEQIGGQQGLLTKAGLEARIEKR